MADSAISVTPGTGAEVDTRTESTNGHQRQVIVIGDPTSNDGIASVDSANGLDVDVTRSALPTGASTLSEQQTQTTALQAIQAAQADGSQKIQIVDAGGDAVSVTGGKLDVNASASLAGESLPIAGATEAVGVAVVDSSGNQVDSFGGTQYTEGDTDVSIKGTAAMMEGAANALLPIQGTVADGLLVNLGSNNDINITQLDGNPIATASGNVSAGTVRTVLANDVALPAGTNNIGDVDVLTLPALPAGNNNIGDVDVASIAAGDNNIGNVDIVSLPAIPAGTNNIGDVDVASIAAGDNNIGNVDVVTLPSLPAGSNSIGTLGANSGVDIGDVTVNNASGASAVNIQDGGNSITVDGSVTANAGTNLNTSALLTTSAHDAAFGTAGTADAQVRSIQGIASMTPVQVSQATASNLNATVVQATGSNLHTVVDSGTITTVTTLTGTTTLTPGTGASNLGKAEDAGHTSADVGVMMLGVRNDALAALSGTDLDYTPIGTDSNGTVHVAQKAGTATLSNVAASASSVTLLSANAARIGGQITNDSSALLYIKFGTTASTTSYTVVVAGAASAPFSYYEIPAGYTGRIDGIWASATGNARLTEETP